MLICMSSNFLKCSKQAFSTFGAHYVSKNSGLLHHGVASLKSATFPTVKKAYRFSFRFPEENPVRWVTKRFYIKRPENRSFEVDANVAKDVTVFTYSNTRFFRMLSIFGIAQFLFWTHMALFAYSGLDRPETNEDQGSWYSNMVVNFQSRYKYRIAVACIALGKQSGELILCGEK